MQPPWQPQEASGGGESASESAAPSLLQPGTLVALPLTLTLTLSMALTALSTRGGSTAPPPMMESQP